MNPQKIAKKPIKVIKYRHFCKGSLSLCLFVVNIKYRPKVNNIIPCPISPNITPNRKGNEIIA